jgi:hypothetical protein
VRAGIVNDPADYRWSSYGEAIGGGKNGNGKKAREGLVRACMSHKGAGFDAEKWKEISRIYRRAMGLALGRKPAKTQDLETQDSKKKKTLGVTNNTEEMLASQDNETILPDLGMAGMLMKRVAYLTAGMTLRLSISASLRFTDGALIGSKGS